MTFGELYKRALPGTEFDVYAISYTSDPSMEDVGRKVTLDALPVYSRGCEKGKESGADCYTEYAECNLYSFGTNRRGTVIVVLDCQEL